MIDADWKWTSAEPSLAADVDQVPAYCTALGSGRGVLVYPGREDACVSDKLKRLPIRLHL